MDWFSWKSNPVDGNSDDGSPDGGTWDEKLLPVSNSGSDVPNKLLRSLGLLPYYDDMRNRGIVSIEELRSNFNVQDMRALGLTLGCVRIDARMQNRQTLSVCLLYATKT